MTAKTLAALSTQPLHTRTIPSPHTRKAIAVYVPTPLDVVVTNTQCPVQVQQKYIQHHPKIFSFYCLLSIVSGEILYLIKTTAQNEVL